MVTDRKRAGLLKAWAQCVQVGATDLIQSLGCHQLQHLSLNIRCTFSVAIRILYQVMNPVLDALNTKVELVNSKRQANGFLPITENMFSVSMLYKK